jgi:hypothetical protein
MDPLAFALPVAGIGLILAVVWLTGGYRTVRLDEALVRRRLAEDQPGFEPAAIALDRGGAAALAAGADGRRFALAFAVGDRIATRLLGPADLGEVRVREATDGATLELDTGDFARRRFRLALAADEAAAWRSRLDALARGAAL